MAASKILLLVISLLVVVAITIAHSSSSAESAKRKKAIDSEVHTKDGVLYHLLEGKKPKPDHPNYNNYHEEEKKTNYFTPASKDYENKHKPEGYHHDPVVPQYSPHDNNNRPHHPPQYHSTTPAPYYHPASPSYKPHRKPITCGCDSKNNYKKLAVEVNNHAPSQPYGLEHVTEAYHEDNAPRTCSYGKESSRKKPCSCGDKKLKKIKHFIIRKTDLPRETNYEEGTEIRNY